jgi:hypothetical protein
MLAIKILVKVVVITLPDAVAGVGTRPTAGNVG